MSAQTIKEMTQQEAAALISQGGGVLLKKGTYALKRLGKTVTLKPGSRPGYVKAITVDGCTC